MYQFLSVTTEQLTELVAQLGEQLVPAFGISSGVLGFVALVLGCIKAGLELKAKKNPVSLTETDRTAIGDEVVAELKEGVTVDMSAQLDKATNQRLALVEENQNALSEQLQTISEGVYAMTTAVAEFKTISAETRAKINDYNKSEPVKEAKKIDVEKVVATVEKVVEVVKEVKDNISY